MKLIALMGKAGSGKDSTLHELIRQYPDQFNVVVSYTSRPPREGERNGIEYYFLTEEEFAKRINRGEMLEYTSFNGWCYGTSRSELSREKINIAILNPNGIKAIMKDPDIDMTVYYVRASDKERLLRQLNREDNPNVEEIIRRFSADEIDFKDLNDITYIILNNETKNDLQNNVDIIMRMNVVPKLELELDGINLELKIEDYKENSGFSDDWCRVTLYLKSNDWLNYRIDRKLILNSYEIDEIANGLEKIMHTPRYGLEEKDFTLEFIEPDIVFKFYDSEILKSDHMLDIEISLWTKDRGLSANRIVLTLLDKDIKKLYNYIQRVRGIYKEEFKCCK